MRKTIINIFRKNKLIFGLISFSLVPRIMGINFGLPDYHFHTDEPLIVNPIVRFLQTLNFWPENYIYPPFHLYLQVILLFPFYVLIRIWEIFTYKMNEGFFLNLVYLLVRLNVAIISSLTALLVYKLGEKVFNRQVGILSSLIYSATFMALFLSHYAKHETLLTFLGAFVMYFGVRFLKEKRKSLLFLCSLFVGLSIMTHYNGLLFLVIPIILTFMLSDIKKSVLNLFLVLVFVFLAMFLGSPTSFFAFEKSVRQVIETYTNFQIYAPAMSNLDGIPNWQWYLIYLFFSGLWYPIFGAFIGGLLLALRKFNRVHLLLVSFLIIYLGFFSKGPQRTDRYLLPLVPPFSIYAGFFVVELIFFIKKVFKNEYVFRLFLSFVFFVFIFLPYLRGLSFSFIITQKDTRQVAAEWLEKNYPKDQMVFAIGDTIHIGQYLQKKGFGNVMNLFPLETPDIFLYPGEILLVDSVNYHVAQNYEKVENFKKFLDNYQLIKGKSKLVQEFSQPLFKAEFFSPAFLEHSSTVNAYHNPTIQVFEIPKISREMKTFVKEYLPADMIKFSSMELVGDSQTSSGQALRASHPRGGIITGPHQPFPAGDYQATFTLKVDDNLSDREMIVLAITDSGGATVFSQKMITANDFPKAGRYHQFSLPFSLLKGSRLETKVIYQGRAPLWVEKIKLKKN